MTKHILPALVAASFLLSHPASAQQETVVAFAKGASSATLKGSIKGDQDHSYLVDARAGQTMTVTLTTTKGSAEMNVWAPGNDTAISLGSPDPYKFTGVLPATGRYKVQVYQMRASARRGETASYALTIGVAGEAPKASRNALVPGTKYNAKMSATKDGDVTTVRIGAAEVYYIPDAFVFGG
jgi:hypothetical protein